MPDLIQFLHPGGEHGPDGPGFKDWNFGDHKRKFLASEGTYLSSLRSKPRKGDVCFWGEWEPQSEVEPIDSPVPGGPRWLHRPYYVSPSKIEVDGAVRQNTDPFVFGGPFHYSICRQWRNSTQRPTKLRDLPAGSVILFGSHKDGEFVLDTVFVTDEGVLHDFETWPRALRGVDATYKNVTLKPGYGWGPGPTFRLYTGATYTEPVDGMFSFVPCLPGAGAGAGFARPALRLPGHIKSGMTMGFKMSRGLSQQKLAQLWKNVVEQTLDQDLALGVEFDMPPRHDA